MPLDKVMKEKDEFRDSNFQVKSHINDLQVSMCALKVTLISRGLGLLKTKSRHLSCDWLNYNRS